MNEGEDSVVAVNLRWAQRLPGNGNDAFSFLAGALRNELLDPESEGGERRGRNESQFVASGIGQRAKNGSQACTGIFVDAKRRSTVMSSVRRTREQGLYVSTHDREWHHAEVRQGRVAAPDVRHVEEYAAEAIARGVSDELSAGI